MRLEPGTRLGPYEVLSPLGAGGMGEVYRARDAKLARDVAVKVLPERVAGDPEALARFEREARAVAAISHPNILAIHDFGKEGPVTYAVTELLEGETLRAMLAGGPLPARKATDYAIQIARGLAAAHEKGIVHRDLKPDNLFVTGDGRVKILDFGLARPTAAVTARDDTRSPTVTSHTEPGAVLGTVGYMSPEQVKGQPVDARSDIFSFGAVLYEMLAGRRAFQGGSHAETMAAILQSDPPELEGSGKALPPALERVLRRCLEKKPEQRFQSASDLAFALESTSRASGPAAAEPIAGGEPIRRPWSASPLLWALLGAAVSGAIVSLLLRPARRGDVTAAIPSVRFTIAPPAGALLLGMLAISPDGGRVAFVATTSDGRDLLFVRALDALEVHPIEGTDGASFPFWSPDSRNVAFFAKGKLKRVDSEGARVQIVCDAASPRGGSWSSGGTIIFSAAAGGEIDRVPEAGGVPVALPAPVSKGMYTYRWPCFLPDGRHFLYFVLGENYGIFVGSIDDAKPKFLFPATSGAVYAAPGFLLYRSGDRLMGHRFDAGRMQTSGEPFPVIDHVTWDGVATGVTALSVSDRGVLACQTGGTLLSRLLWFDRSGRELGAVGPDGAYFEPAISPDDRWLVVSSIVPDTLEQDLRMFDLERGGSLRLASSQNLVPATPLWTTDGLHVLFSDFFSGKVYQRDARGVEGEKVLVQQPSFTPLDDLSRDGRLLFYEALNFRTFHTDTRVRDMQSGEDRPLLEAAFNEQGARLSPDGRWLAYESEESGQFEVFVRSFPGAGERRQISKGGGRQPRWRRDGKELFYVSPDRKIVAVDVRTGAAFEAGLPKPLFQTRIRPQIEARNHYDVTSDGQHFVVNSFRQEDAAVPITVLAPWRKP
jgi:hypothetical protein